MKTALYLRSSKDRSDVSIDSQRRELTALAKNKAGIIVQEYADIVESAKDEHRPGFQAMIRDLRSSTRKWDAVMMVDTSRLSRNIYVAEVFKHECRKRGVTIIYSKLPETNPIMDMVMVQILQAFDQMHSMMSREKGLAGMAENVRQGYRAGGRAPFGYQLQHIETGSMREGVPVTKSKLVSSKDAPRIRDYLKQRAQGISRKLLIERMKLDMAATTLIGIEWNALTYAGATVWNVHNEFNQGEGYKGGVKRKPRSDWVIQKDTHEPLISFNEAETIIRNLEKSNASRKRRTPAKYLLTGVLQTSEGLAWHGDGNGLYYRAGKGRKVRAAEIDKAILGKMMADLHSPKFINSLVNNARTRIDRNEYDEEVSRLKAQIEAINGKIGKLVDLVTETTNPAPLLRKIEEAESRRDELVMDLKEAESLKDSQAALSQITPASVGKMLDGLAENLEGIDPESLKDLIAGMVDRITLDPADLTCRIFYKFPAKRGDKLASPRESDSIPSISAMTRLKLWA